MKEMKCFPEEMDVKRIMDLYFQVRTYVYFYYDYVASFYIEGKMSYWNT